MKRSRVVFAGLAVLTVFLSVFLFARALYRQTRLEADRESCEEAIHLFMRGSDTMTEAVFTYADTADRAQMDAYWAEVDNTHSRDTAVALLEARVLSPEEKTALHTAARCSNELMELEIHAMRLIAASEGLSPETLPAAVAAWPLTAEEEALSPAEQDALADRLLFGRDYATLKEQIIRASENFSYNLNGRFGQTATDNMRRAWIIISVGITAFFGMLLLSLRASRQEEARRREDLRQREECFRIVANQTGHFVFRYDIPTQTYHHITGYDGPLEKPPAVVPGFPEKMLRSGMVKDESVPSFRAFFRQLDAGEAPAETDIRLIERGGGACWFRFSATLVPSADGRPATAVVSYADSGSLRERELAYARWTQEMADLTRANVVLDEWNLTGDVFESARGRTDTDKVEMAPRHFNEHVRHYAARFVYVEDRNAVLTAFSREKLIGMYHSGRYSSSLECREKQPNGSLRWIRITVRLVLYPLSDDIKAYIMRRDIDAEKKSEIALIEQSETDPLTGAYNRRAFIAKVKAILQAEPEANRLLLMMDIDEFKHANDTYGHECGDRMLRGFAEGVRHFLRPGDLIGRIGGDEFMVFVPDALNMAAMEKKARLLLNAMPPPPEGGKPLTISVGAAVAPRDGTDFEELYKRADIALYKTKNSGKNSFCFYAPDMEERGHILTGFD